MAFKINDKIMVTGGQYQGATGWVMEIKDKELAAGADTIPDKYYVYLNNSGVQTWYPEMWLAAG